MPSSLARSPERDLLRRNRNTGMLSLHVFATQPFFLLLETRLDSRFISKPICRAFLVLRLLQLSFVALAPGVSPVSPPSGVFTLLSAMAELEEEETVAAAPEPEEEVTDLNGAVRGVLLGWPGRWVDDGWWMLMKTGAGGAEFEWLGRLEHVLSVLRHLACPQRDLPHRKRDRETLHAIACFVYWCQGQR